MPFVVDREMKKKICGWSVGREWGEEEEDEEEEEEGGERREAKI
jgi:hypothetical protein